MNDRIGNTYVKLKFWMTQPMSLVNLVVGDAVFSPHAIGYI